MTIVKHYKGGLYHVEGTATHTETGEELTVYRDSNGQLWVRPTEMFIGYVSVCVNQEEVNSDSSIEPVYKKVKRFERVGSVDEL